MLTPTDLADFERLGITVAVLDQMQVRRLDDRQARELLGVRGRPGRFDGIVFPYLQPGEARAKSYRLRRDHPEVEAGIPQHKYFSAFGARRHLYVAVTDPAVLMDPTVPVILVEAEKSVLAVTCAARRLGRSVLALGLGGCYGWRGRIGNVTDAHGARVDEVGPLPDFDTLTWTDRDSILAFDANAATNWKVQAARRALAFELRRRGARVRILAVPVEEGVNGPDDYIGRHGDAAFFGLLDTAAEAGTFDAVVRLNAKHAVVLEAGKTVVITDEQDPVLKRRVLRRSTFADFRNFYLNERIQVGDRWKPLGHVWLAHPDRRQYDGLVMSPGGDVPGFLNLWRGFAVTPRPGDWSLLREHIQQVICANHPALLAYVMGWLASGVQHPERQAESALALRGLRGTGKGIFARTYGELFGQHFLQIANSKHLTGNFNAHLQDCLVLFADEAFWAGDKAGESVLKMLVTEPMIPIERKGRDLVQVRNMLHIIIASNHDWLVPAGRDERRFCVLDMVPTHAQDHAYFAAIVAQLDAGGRAAFLYDLLQFDLAGVNLRDVPATEALREQKVLSLLPNERWLFDKLMAGRWLPKHTSWQTIVVKRELHDDYIQSLQRVGVERRATQTELGMFISKMFPDAESVQRTIEGKRQSCWEVQDLPTCRATFDANAHCHHPWNDDDDADEPA